MIVESSWLRSLAALAGTAPDLDVAFLPSDPHELFRDWIQDAVAAGVAEPHAATLATVDATGLPDARTLLLKAVDDAGWAFAGSRKSVKGAQLASAPVAALNFWWQPVVRAVRVRGTVREAPPADSRSDFLARPESARSSADESDWVLWRLQASAIEFWQGSTDRNHSRIVYAFEDGRWTTPTVSGDTTDSRKKLN